MASYREGQESHVIVEKYLNDLEEQMKHVDDALESEIAPASAATPETLLQSTPFDLHDLFLRLIRFCSKTKRLLLSRDHGEYSAGNTGHEKNGFVSKTPTMVNVRMALQGIYLLYLCYSPSSERQNGFENT